VTTDGFRRSWWLAPPGLARRAQFTIVWLAILGAVGLAAGLLAEERGASADTSLWLGIGAAIAAEIAVFAIPVRISSEHRIRLPATPERVFAMAIDPTLVPRLSAIGVRLIDSSGVPGSVGSRYVLAAAGVRIVTTVLRSDPPREIVIEMRARLTRSVITRRYTPVDGDTNAWVRNEQRMPLGYWLLAPVFQSEVRSAMAEGQRRIRAYLQTEPLPDA
jgi:polyketide cyclase/dehydrase/lipid transport protein